ncbi:MAG: DUF4091 domain-containing protein [Trueperaceae bacterium]|nr:DUF4091 domain-containing protein [Trueperaceae bacterium]
MKQAGFKLALAFFVLLFLAACVVLEPDFVGPKTWTFSSMDRVARGEWESLDSRTITRISAARNEYEAFQLNIRAPSGGLHTVQVTVSPFQHEAGYSLPDAKLYREHYVHVDRGGFAGSPVNRNRALGAGWYADALIPFEAPGTAEIPSHPFNVEARQNQPVWVDVFIPEDAPAGLYTSRYTVESAEGTSTGTIELEVWDFSLPKTPSLKSSFIIWDEKTPAMRDLLLEHKLMPRNTPVDEQADRIANDGLNAADLRFWAHSDIDCQFDNPPSVEEIKARLANYQHNLLVYNYSADEIDRCSNITDKMRAWGRNLHEAGVPQLVVMFPQRQLFDDGNGRSAVDIWVFSPELYVENRDAQAILDEALAISEAWSYTALMKLDDIPKWGIDFMPMNYRIMQGFLNQRYGLTGLLYWRVNLWQANPWRDVTSNEATWPAGEGMLVYPGEQIGQSDPVPSLRLKWLREGVDDFEYGQILRDRGQENQLKQLIRPAAQDWRTWTKDPLVIEDVRQSLAQAILGQ